MVKHLLHSDLNIHSIYAELPNSLPLCFYLVSSFMPARIGYSARLLRTYTIPTYPRARIMIDKS